LACSNDFCRADLASRALFLNAIHSLNFSDAVKGRVSIGSPLAKSVWSIYVVEGLFSINPKTFPFEFRAAITELVCFLLISSMEINACGISRSIRLEILAKSSSRPG
jgi:hypothetical protein